MPKVKSQEGGDEGKNGKRPERKGQHTEGGGQPNTEAMRRVMFRASLHHTRMGGSQAA